MTKLTLLITLLLTLTNMHSVAKDIPSSPRSKRAIAKVKPYLTKELATRELKFGAPVFIRIFKQPGVLEVWLQNNNDKFQLFKRYNICTFSGEPGPKLKEGDKQSPEGFYSVKPKQLNPWSRFHLSFNLGYPNQYDQYHKRTGSALMVHGNCVSIGCYAMTDNYIDEIYALVDAALGNGQDFFSVHIFPFPLHKQALHRYRDNQWYDFWRNLQDGYLYFEEHKIPPDISVKKGRYHFNHPRWQQSNNH